MENGDEKDQRLRLGLGFFACPSMRHFSSTKLLFKVILLFCPVLTALFTRCNLLVSKLMSPAKKRERRKMETDFCFPIAHDQ